MSECWRPFSSAHQVPATSFAAAEIASYKVFWDDKVRFCITHKGFDDPLGLRVSRLTEVGPEAIVAGKAHIGGRRHDDVGDDAAF